MPFNDMVIYVVGSGEYDELACECIYGKSKRMREKNPGHIWAPSPSALYPMTLWHRFWYFASHMLPSSGRFEVQMHLQHAVREVRQALLHS